MLQELKHTGAKIKSLLCKGLAVVLATSVCAATTPLIFCGGGLRSAFAADDGNSWQIVDCAYDASHTTSQGISSSDLSRYNFIESSDGQVRVTKTLEPTGVEDEFIVHLSVDTSATSVQVTDYKSFFENASYGGTSANNYHSSDLGTIIGSPTGNQKVHITGKVTPGYDRKAYFTIQDPDGNAIAENVTMYFDTANNVTFYLTVKVGSTTSYILMGVEVKKDSDNNTVRLSKEAYTLIQQAIAGQVEQGDPANLKLVTDEMGDNVEYIGNAVVDSGTTEYDSMSRTLTWNPSYNSSYTKVSEDPVEIEERNEAGAVTKVTITQRTWYYGAASLTYKVRLNTQATDFKSSYNPDSVSNPYLTNNNATLNYSYSIDGGSTYQNGSVEFPKPSVKGILYDLQLLKTNEIGTPIAGAVFQLTRTWADSLGVTHTDLVSDSLKSDSNGYVDATGLAWGTYTLTETQAPRGHNLPETEALRTCAFNLSYTGNKDALTASTITDTSKNHAMIAGDTPSMQNERVKTDVTLFKVDSDTNDPLAGAKFALYADDGDGKFNETSDLLDAKKVGEITTGEDGKDVFEKLTVGTYYLKETYAPTGYQLSTNIYRIRVYDVKGEAGGTDGNMIQVGDADGTNMQAPTTANTVSIANKPNPKLPVTAGPGIGPIVGGGFILLLTGAAVLVFCDLRARRQLHHARHLVLKE